MPAYRVLVIGGYGFFGSRLVERLSRQEGVEVLVGGRSRVMATGLESVVLDSRAPGLANRLRELRLDAVIDASGPFQDQDYVVPKACIEAGVHAIDLADAPAYVAGIGALDADAQRAGVLVTSGASSVPALSSAAVDELAAAMAAVNEIDIGISPGNRTERGLATVRSVLSYCGKPLSGGGGTTGWSGAWRHEYPVPVGSRLLSPCDVPDLLLLGPRYAGNPRVRFGAGLELELLHRGMNVMAMLARHGVVRDWSRHAPALKGLSDLFRNRGTDAGAMHVTVTGKDTHGNPMRKTWELVATHGDGPFVPTLAAAALVENLSTGMLAHRGALPCVGLLSLADFARAAEGLHIRTTIAG